MTGKYQPYPAYKNSGVEWLGEMPSHWTISKLRYEFSFGKGLSITKANLSEKGVPCINYGEVHSKYGFEVNPKKHHLKCVSDKYLIDHKFSLLTHGDIVFADTSEDLDGSGNFTQLRLRNDVPVFAGYHTIIARPKSRKSNRFYAYLLDSRECRTQIRNTVKGVKVFSITQEILRGARVWLPPIDERKKIANFLDHETAKIDTLVAKQEKLIELLQEKRQAVISHAVTKGLDPDAPMKASGVEWLGEVPAHWNIKSFGHISHVVRGGSPRPAGDPTLFNGDYSPWVTVAEITKNDHAYLTKTESFLTKKGSEQCRVFSSGTLLISNSGATLGVPKILKIDANANDGVVGFERLMINHEFAYFYICTITNDLRDRIKQGSGQPNLNTDIIKKIAIPIPPDTEIVEIVTKLNKKVKKFKQIESKAHEGISLLKERRTALISAAVTGKIDVRNWEAKETQDA